MAATLLVTLTGRDRPGVTSTLFTALSTQPVTVLDVEQVVIRGRLVLGVLLEGDLTKLPEVVRDVARTLDMELDLLPGADENDPRRRGRVVVTVLGAPLLPGAVAAVARTIAAADANIDRIVRLASYPVTGLELEVSGADPDRLRSALAVTASSEHVDVAVQPAGLHHRAKRLVCLDVDSTLVRGEVIEMLAEQCGCVTEVAAITERAMRGELDFEQSLRARVALLGGLPVSAVDAVRSQVELTPGASTLVRTLKRLGYRLGIVSGGFTHITDHLVAELDLDFAAANTLEIVDGRLTGQLAGPVVDRAGKADALRHFADEAGIPMSQTVAIGDGANDLDMLNAAGLGIAFNAKPVVREAAHTAVNVPYLDAILYLLGITREDVEAGDAADGVD
ncbi:MAG: phosphoserine phosphatase SerB [Candidatus Nanopelagicales bacterium]